ncbi:MAG: hypothetical protein IK115_10535 [Lachnospiraceae bacterium]|nr:hypothetical protein [Lachnospiraceae bacterium]
MKIRKLKRALALASSLLLLAGEAMPVLAAGDGAEDATELVAGEAAEESVAEEEEAVAEEPADGEEPTTSRQVGSGTWADPWNLVFGEDLSGELKLAENYGGDWYYFEAKEDGMVTVEGCVPDGVGAAAGNITIWDSNAIAIFDHGINGSNEYGFSTVPQKYFGVKAGKRFAVRVCKGHENGYHQYRFRISFEKSDVWECEPDSVSECKTIDLNKEYFGVLQMDTLMPDTLCDKEDYFHFKLKKKTKVEIWLNCSWNLGFQLYKKSFDSKSIYENGLNVENGKATGVVTLTPGDYYIRIGGGGMTWTEYSFMLNVASKDPVTGTASLNGAKVRSLKEAFSLMNDKDTDYVIELESDMIGEKNLTVPKKARSVTIKGNGHVIEIVGTKFTANAPLILENVSFRAKTKKEAPAKFTLNAKKGLSLEESVSFEAARATVNTTELKLKSTLSANVVSCRELKLEEGGELIAAKDSSITVKTSLNGNGGVIQLAEGFNKPISLGGSAKGVISFNGAVQADGTQILRASEKKLKAEELKTVFDVSGITENAVETRLCYFARGKAGIFGSSISFNGAVYALWKDAVAAMNEAKAGGEKNLTVSLLGNVNLGGRFLLPKKGYEQLTIEGNGFSMSFTGDIKLTGNTTITDTTLIKLDKKGQPAKLKIKKGKYNYAGPEGN